MKEEKTKDMDTLTLISKTLVSETPISELPQIQKKFNVKKRKLAAIIVTAIVTLIALCIGFGIYNAPTKRLARHLEVAYKYLEEMNYEQAIVEFDMAIEIEPMSVEAYLGKAQVYESLGDIDKVTETLEKGYEMTAENSDVKEKLVEMYFGMAGEKVQGKDYKESLSIYDRLLELDASDEKIINGLCDCLKKYIDMLMEAKRYDEIRALAQKYGNIAKNVDFNSIMARIDEIEEYMVLVDNILIHIASLCEEENYHDVFGLMQMEEYEKFLINIDEIQEIYGIETDYGKIGIYKVDSEMYGNYMIYYGDYKEDKRHGQGVWLGYYDGNNYIAEGSWVEDLPQGEFLVREWYGELADDVVYRVISGNIDEGFWDGDVLWKFEETGEEKVFPVTFENGNWIVLWQEDNGNLVVGEGTSALLVVEEAQKNEKHGIVGFGERY